MPPRPPSQPPTTALAGPRLSGSRAPGRGNGGAGDKGDDSKGDDSKGQAPRRGRPPRARPGRDGDTRSLLIRTGLAILTEKGYSAAGLDEILRSAAVPKGSFYHHFSGKEAFGSALIEAYGRYFAAKLDHWFLDHSLPPLARFQAFIDDAREGMRRHEFRRGCLVGNLGQEMGGLPESFRHQLVTVFETWQARTAVCLDEALAAGQIAPPLSSSELASMFWIGWEGAVLRAKLERRSEPIDTFAAGFMALLRPTI